MALIDLNLQESVDKIVDEGVTVKLNVSAYEYLKLGVFVVLAVLVITLGTTLIRKTIT